MLVRTANARHQESRAIHWMKNFRRGVFTEILQSFSTEDFSLQIGYEQCVYRGVYPTENQEIQVVHRPH
jgi:hypothetical protein